MHAQEMISTHPQATGKSNDALIRSVEACYDCAQACTSCADACLGEGMVPDMIASGPASTARISVRPPAALATRSTGSNETVVAAQLQVCEDACRICAEECERHAARMGHCGGCGEASLRCEDACAEARRAFAPPLQ